MKEGDLCGFFWLFRNLFENFWYLLFGFGTVCLMLFLKQWHYNSAQKLRKLKRTLMVPTGIPIYLCASTKTLLYHLQAKFLNIVCAVSGKYHGTWSWYVQYRSLLGFWRYEAVLSFLFLHPSLQDLPLELCATLTQQDYESHNLLIQVCQDRHKVGQNLLHDEWESSKEWTVWHCDSISLACQFQCSC